VRAGWNPSLPNSFGQLSAMSMEPTSWHMLCCPRSLSNANIEIRPVRCGSVANASKGSHSVLAVSECLISKLISSGLALLNQIHVDRLSRSVGSNIMAAAPDKVSELNFEKNLTLAYRLRVNIVLLRCFSMGQCSTPRPC
jgi:hypothetical protein